MNKKIFQVFFFLIMLIAFGVIIKNFVDSIESNIEDYNIILKKAPPTKISRIAPIIIKFSQDIDENKFPINVPLNIEILKFNPAIKGFYTFTDERTLEFQPNEPLSPGTKFSAKLYIEKIFPEIKLKSYHFKFSTPSISFKVRITETVYFDSLNSNVPYLKGNIVFNDYVEHSKRIKLISAYQNNKKLAIDFLPEKNNKSVEFKIIGINRTNESKAVKVKWSGKPINIETTDSTMINIVSSNSFDVVYCKQLHFPEPGIILRFSDSINTKEPIDSFISITNLDKYSLSISNNQIKIQFDTITESNHKLIISKYLTNNKNITLSNDFSFEFNLSQPKPFIGLTNNSIYNSPSKSPNILNINALNLNTFNLKITHIPDKNMMQFLQINNIDETKEMDRVGKNIYNKAFNLTNDLDFNPNQLTEYHLNILDIDLSKNGLYQFSFSYDINDVVHCINKNGDSDKDEECNTYNYNVIYSDILAVAKQTDLDTLYIFTNSLNSGLPIKKARVEIYDFQQNRLGTLITNEKGTAKIKLLKKNIFIKIQFKNDITYLKINAKTSINKVSQINSVKTNKGSLCYIEGLKNTYAAADSILIGIVLKKHSANYSKSKPVEIRLESPDKTVFERHTNLLPGSFIEKYSAMLPNNSKPGIWNIIISDGLAEFKYPFKVIKQSNLELPVFFSIDKKKKSLVIQYSSLGNYLKNQTIFVKISPHIYSPELAYPNFIFNNSIIDTSANEILIKAKFNKYGKALIKLPSWVNDESDLTISGKINFTDDIILKKDTIISFQKSNSWLGLNTNWETDTTLAINILKIEKNSFSTSSISKIELKINKTDNNQNSINILLTDTIEIINGKGNTKWNSKDLLQKDYVIKITDIENNTYVQTKVKSKLLNKNIASSISVKTDKTSYKSGDSCHVYLNSKNKTTALFTIENGSQIFMSKWIQLKPDTSLVSFIVDKNMSQGFYISVLKNNTKIENTEKYVKVLRSKSSLSSNIVAEIPYDWKPKKNTQIKLFNNGDDNINYLIYIIPLNKKESKKLLFKEYFNQIQENSIVNWSSIYLSSNKNNNIIDESDYLKSFEAETFKYGYQNNHFLIGPFALNQTEKKVHNIKIPYSKGEIEVKIFGISEKDGEVFEINHKANITEPISIKPQIPQYLNAEDILYLPITITNNQFEPDTLTVEISESKNLDILGSISKKLIINKNSSATFYTIIKAKKENCIGQMLISVNSTHTHVNNKIVIPIYSNPIYLFESTQSKLENKMQYQKTLMPFGIKGSNNAIIEIATVQTPKLWELINTLDEFNNDNLKTLINRAFTLLFLNKIIDNKEEIRQNTEKIKETILAIYKYQTRDGSFFNKMNFKEPDIKLTCYTGEFMLISKLNGYSINTGVLNRWKRFQQTELQRIKYSYNKSNSQASYILYTLSLDRLIEANQIDNFTNSTTNKLLDKLLIASSYVNIDKNRIAKSMINTDSLKLNIQKLSLNESLRLLNLSLDLHITDLATELVEHINSTITQKSLKPCDITLAINSILNYLLKENIESNINLTYQVNNGKKNLFNTTAPLSFIDIPLEFTLAKNIDFLNTSNGTIYLTTTQKGSPQKIKNKQGKMGLKVYNKFKTLNDLPINTRKIQNNQLFKQVITFVNTNKNNSRNITVNIPIPAGASLEYSNIKMSKIVTNSSMGLIRTELNINPLSNEKIILILRAKYSGKFISYPIKTISNNLFYNQIITNQFDISIN